MEKLSLVMMFIVILSGCTTMLPVRSDVSFPGDSSTYEILGRVESNEYVKTAFFIKGKSGYSKLLEEAILKYPRTDDVVNIIVDIQETRMLFDIILLVRSYHMSGIAIEYKKKEDL